jgi:hypothetical protein
MKTYISLLKAGSLSVLMVKTLTAADSAPAAFRPNWSGDDHDNPVYTSPTNGLVATTSRTPVTNSEPVLNVKNWPLTNLPPITNSVNTNLPPMTNPPPLNPPGGK